MQAPRARLRRVSTAEKKGGSTYGCRRVQGAMQRTIAAAAAKSVALRMRAVACGRLRAGRASVIQWRRENLLPAQFTTERHATP
jgi:hypothetical protein